MLRTFRSLRELDYSNLFDIYRGSLLASMDHDAIWKAEQDFYNYLNDVFFADPHAMYAVWDAEGSYCAALRLERYRDGLIITGLETKPEARGKGYATALIEQVLQDAADKGWRCIYSHVYKNNTISLHVHLKNSFSIISDSAALIDGSFSPNCYTLRCDLSPRTSRN